MQNRSRKRLGCLLLAIVVMAAVPIATRSTVGAHFGETSNTMKAISDCRLILTVMKQYAAANEGSLDPALKRSDLKSANQVFRELFKTGILEDERIFLCPGSVFKCDGKIGTAPEYAMALEPGENHWMLLQHQRISAHPKTPVIIENALNSHWPPRWDASWRPDFLAWLTNSTKSKAKGHAWTIPYIIIGRLDGTVAMERIGPDGALDWHSAANLDQHGKSWIDYLTPDQIAKLEYWDVEERKP